MLSIMQPSETGTSKQVRSLLMRAIIWCLICLSLIQHLPHPHPSQASLGDLFATTSLGHDGWPKSA